MATTNTDPITLITGDHRKVERLFSEIESAEGESRQQLVDELVTELLVHMKLEEDLVYPLVEEEVDAEMAEEGEVEHRLAREGMDQLRKLAPDEPGFGAALDMLKAGIQHHVKEEEHEVLPKLRQKLNASELSALGEELATTKADLLEAGPGKLRFPGKGGNGRGRGGRDGGPTKAELVDEARDKGLSGYSKMTKAQLEKALASA